MTVATVAVDLYQPLDVAPYLTAEITLHRVLALHDRSQTQQLLISQVLHLNRRFDLRLRENFPSKGTADTVDIRQGKKCLLVVGDLNPCYSCQTPLLALPLLMLRVRTNNTQPTMSPDNLAAITTPSYRCRYLHRPAPHLVPRGRAH